MDNGSAKAEWKQTDRHTGYSLIRYGGELARISRSQGVWTLVIESDNNQQLLGPLELEEAQRKAVEILRRTVKAELSNLRGLLASLEDVATLPAQYPATHPDGEE